MPLLYRRLPELLVNNYFYYKIGRFKIVLIVAGKGQKLYKNYVENSIGKTYNFTI